MTGLDFATLFEPIQTTIMSALSAVIPIGVAILGVVLAVRKGASLIRGLSGR
ncbi:MAG: hypothetical protein ACPL5F_01030 [Moorellaceae bacterium]